MTFFGYIFPDELLTRYRYLRKKATVPHLSEKQQAIYQTVSDIHFSPSHFYPNAPVGYEESYLFPFYPEVYPLPDESDSLKQEMYDKALCLKFVFIHISHEQSQIVYHLSDQRL